MAVSPALRPPPGNPRFPLVDSLRAIAALMVVVCHVSFLTGAYLQTTWGRFAVELASGVMVFFVISGFLLYRPYVAARVLGRPRPALATYARRRIFRIVPAYWVALTFLAILPGTPYVVGPLTHHWWVFYGFGQVYSTNLVGHGLGVAWSLCIEVTFYAALPLYALVADRLSARFGTVRGDLLPLAVVFAAGTTIDMLAAADAVGPGVRLTLPATMQLFALGMGIAWASVELERRGGPGRVLTPLLRRTGYGWIVAVGALVMLTWLFPIKSAVTAPHQALRALLGVALISVMAVSIVLPAVFGPERGSLVRRLLAWRPAAWVGMVSYGIYLWHLPLLLWLSGIAPGKGQVVAHTPVFRLLPDGFVRSNPFVALALIGVPLVIAAGAASYYIVELPFLRRKERRGLPAFVRVPLSRARPGLVRQR